MSSANSLHWVKSANGHIPSTALSAQGVERTGQPLYIARSHFKGGLQPGKAAPFLTDGGFAVGWGGTSHSLNEYEVLCGEANYTQWIPQQDALKTANLRLVEGGREADGRALYVARASIDNSLNLGKCGEHLAGGMSCAYGGRERVENQYMVLAYL